MKKLLNFIWTRIYWGIALGVSTILCIFNPSIALRFINALVATEYRRVNEESN